MSIKGKILNINHVQKNLFLILRHLEFRSNRLRSGLWARVCCVCWPTPSTIDRQPWTISQLDEDYFEIEPPRPPSYDSDVNIQRLYYQDAGAVSNQVEYEKSTSAGIGLKFATRSFGITLRTDQTEYKHDKQYRFNSDNDSYSRVGLVLGTKLEPALVGANFQPPEPSIWHYLRYLEVYH